VSLLNVGLVLLQQVWAVTSSFIIVVAIRWWIVVRHMILHVRVEAKLAKLVWVTIRHHHMRWELVITDLLWIRRSMTIDTMAFWRLSSCWLGLLLLLFVQNDIISDVLNKGIWVRNLVSKGRNLLHRDGLADRLLSLLLLVRGIVVDILVH